MLIQSGSIINLAACVRDKFPYRVLIQSGSIINGKAGLNLGATEDCVNPIWFYYKSVVATIFVIILKGVNPIWFYYKL